MILIYSIYLYALVNSQESDMELRLVTGGSCLDGSPMGYYYQPGHDDGSTKWMIYHEGGGWCTSMESCFARSKTILGSTLYRPQYLNTGSLTAEFSGDSSLNMLMYNWNKVLLVYCDGGSFTGNNVSGFNNSSLHFTGRQNLLAVRRAINMTNTTDVVISGCSAGGLAVYFHLDWWREQIPDGVKVVGLAIDGFILDSNDVYGFDGLADYMRWIYTQMNSSTDSDCATMDSKCMFAGYLTGYIKTPLFIMNSKYNYHSVIGLGSRVNEFGDTLVNQIANSSGFIDACVHHCTRHALVINGINSTYAFWLFYNSGQSAQYIEPRAYLCLTCCGWSTELICIVAASIVFTAVCLVVMVALVVFASKKYGSSRE